MDTRKLWIFKLQEYLRSHIHSGLQKTLSDVRMACNGRNLGPAIQVTMEGIPYLGTHILNEDFKVFTKKLYTFGLSDTEFDEILMKAYQATALNALKDAGLNCDRFDISYIEGPLGVNFVHKVYINTGRSIWYDPDILINGKSSNGTGINSVIDEGIEKAIYDGIDLNKLVKDMKCGRKNKSSHTSSHTSEQYPKTTRQQINTDKVKCILDSDSESDDELEQAKNIVVNAAIANPVQTPSSPSLNQTASVTAYSNHSGIPPRPILDDEKTVDDEMLAPDNVTIASEAELVIPITLGKTVTSITSESHDTLDMTSDTVSGSDILNSKPLGNQHINVELEDDDTETDMVTIRTVKTSNIRASSQPTSSQPMTSQPMSSQPMTNQPMTNQPMTSQPMTSQPTSSQPTSSQPTTSQPVFDVLSINDPELDFVPQPKGPIYRVELITHADELSRRKEILNNR
jgi:hypothetical protein